VRTQGADGCRPMGGLGAPGGGAREV
jgi:hypothetical protein